jgi:uncharacterized protein YndB with AHSA1/START domain
VASSRPARSVSAERDVAAPAHDIFEVLADPAQHPLIDGSSSVVRPLGGNPERLELGSRFGMAMRLIVPYTIHCRVVEYEADKLIAWAHFGGHRWRYELSSLDVSRESGRKTRVTETFDWSTSHFPLVIEALGFPARNLPAMAHTLERLDRHVRGESLDG